jgi:predicted Zn-dependent protease
VLENNPEIWFTFDMPKEAGCKKYSGVVLALLLALFTACTAVPETGRSQFNLIPVATERAMGRSAFTRIKASTPLSNDQEATAMLQRVGRRISAVAKLPNAQWEFVLFEKSQANAFCLPGGKVGVNTGILRITQTEVGLATVLAHEVAHAAAHHSAERVSRMMAIQGIVIAVIANVNNVSAGTRNLLYAGYGLGTTVGSELPHGRRQEFEADEIGLIYMARAGYDPTEALRFWERFIEHNKKKGSNMPWFLRTHPLDEQRIVRIKRLLPVAMREYQSVSTRTVTLISPSDGEPTLVRWKPRLTLYSARRSAGLNQVSAKSTIERAGKTFPAEPATVLRPGDVVRWK